MYCENCGNKLADSDKFCSKCGKGQSSVAMTSMEYFAISPRRFVWFSILTFNLYHIYWFYKNWKQIKEQTGEKINPFLRGLFAIFFCQSLFKRVLKSATDSGYSKTYSPNWLTAAYVLLILGGNALGEVDVEFGVGLALISILVPILAFLPLLPIQRAINYNNSRVREDFQLKKSFSGGEVALIVFGIIWFSMIVIGTFMP